MRKDGVLHRVVISLTGWHVFDWPTSNEIVKKIEYEMWERHTLSSNGQ